MVPPAPRDVLLRIIDNVFGYGCLGAPLWFVGIEEHCDDENGAARRLPAMATFVGAQDVLAAHELMNHPNPMNTGVWPQMQNIVEAAGLSHVEVGRRDSDTFLTELLPLPHANEDLWYSRLYGALGYADRQQYVERVMTRRISGVRELVRRHRPKVVLVHHSFGDEAHLNARRRHAEAGEAWA